MIYHRALSPSEAVPNPEDIRPSDAIPVNAYRKVGPLLGERKPARIGELRPADGLAHIRV